jgi:hypothetical protein
MLFMRYVVGEEDDDTLPKLINVISNLKHSGYDAKTITKNLFNITICKQEKKSCKVRSMG